MPQNTPYLNMTWNKHNSFWHKKYCWMFRCPVKVLSDTDSKSEYYNSRSVEQNSSYQAAKHSNLEYQNSNESKSSKNSSKKYFMK